MNEKKKVATLLLVIFLLTSTVTYADEFDLQDLRLFFTPQERNPVGVVSEQKVTTTPRAQPVVVQSTPPLRYIGAIRSQNKKRLFWKRGFSEYVTTVPKVNVREGSHGKSNQEAASGSTKTKASK